MTAASSARAAPPPLLVLTPSATVAGRRQPVPAEIVCVPVPSPLIATAVPMKASAREAASLSVPAAVLMT